MIRSLAMPIRPVTISANREARRPRRRTDSVRPMATDRMRPTTVPTRARPVVERLHGVDVADPYRWLEDGDDPEVRRWTEAQNAATRDFLDRVAGRDALEARLRALHEIGALGVAVSRGHGGGRRIFQTRRDGRQNQPVLYV